MTHAGQCSELISRFFYCLDEFLYDDLIDFFTPDAIWFRQGVNLSGHEEIRAAMNIRGHRTHVKHVITNIFPIRSDGITKYSSYMTAYRFAADDRDGDAGAVGYPFKFSRIEFELERIGEDVKIAKMIMNSVFDFGTH